MRSRFVPRPFPLQNGLGTRQYSLRNLHLGAWHFSSDGDSATLGSLADATIHYFR